MGTKKKLLARVWLKLGFYGCHVRFLDGGDSRRRRRTTTTIGEKRGGTGKEVIAREKGIRQRQRSGN